MRESNQRNENTLHVRLHIRKKKCRSEAMKQNLGAEKKGQPRNGCIVKPFFQ